MDIKEYKQLANEHDECIDLVSYLDLLMYEKKILAYTKVPNETYTKSWNQKRKNKLEGVNPGFPDYIVATTKELVFIEMKRVKGGVVSDNQKAWHAILGLLGYKVAVCNGFAEAKMFLQKVI